MGIEFPARVGRRSSTVFGCLIPCKYSYNINTEILSTFSAREVRSTYSVEPNMNSKTKTNSPLGKHPNNAMPYKIILRYGIGAV